MESVRRCQGLPCAGHNWFQAAPTDTLQGIAEPLSHDGSASGIMYLRIGNMLPGSVRSAGRKSMRKSL